MKNVLKMVVCLAVLGACVSTPKSDKEVEGALFSQHVAQSCIQKGWVSDLPSMVNYATYQGNDGSRGASVTQINTARQNIAQQYPTSGVTMQHCRSVQALAVQLAQEQAHNRQQRQQASAGFDAMIASGQPTAPAYSRPVTCQHYQWGNATFCN